MGTLVLFVVMTSTPVWFQGEGVACLRAMQDHAPIYMMTTRGGVDTDGAGQRNVWVDEADNVLHLVTCHEE